MADRDVIIRGNEILAVPRTGERGLIGEVKMYAGLVLPDGFLWCNGAAVSTLLPGGYPDLALAIVGSFNNTTPTTLNTALVANGSDTLTINFGTAPTVGDVLIFSNVDTYFGLTIPPGSPNPFLALYVVATPTGTTYKVSETPGGAPLVGISAGTIDCLSSFQLPDLRGRVGAGRDNMGGTDANRLTTVSNDGDILGVQGGAETHTLSTAQIPSHAHDNTVFGLGDSAGSFGYSIIGGSKSGSMGANTGSAGGGSAHNNLQPFQIVNYIIRAE